MKTILAILLLSAPVLSQQPSKLPSQQPPLWNWSDAALGGAMLADETTTAHALSSCVGCREWGISNPGLRIGLKAGIFGFFKAWEYKKPEDRRKIRWVKLAFSGLFVAVSVHNMKPKN